MRLPKFFGKTVQCKCETVQCKCETAGANQMQVVSSRSTTKLIGKTLTTKTMHSQRFKTSFTQINLNRLIVKTDDFCLRMHFVNRIMCCVCNLTLARSFIYMCVIKLISNKYIYMQNMTRENRRLVVHCCTRHTHTLTQLVFFFLCSLLVL